MAYNQWQYVYRPSDDDRHSNVFEAGIKDAGKKHHERDTDITLFVITPAGTTNFKDTSGNTTVSVDGVKGIVSSNGNKLSSVPPTNWNDPGQEGEERDTVNYHYKYIGGRWYRYAWDSTEFFGGT
jgi:hypothetical protein